MNGPAINRIDGRDKVTGKAKYAGEWHPRALLYGVVVSAGIAKGKIVRIDASQALALPGVLQVFTHENRPKLPRLDRSYRDDDSPAGSPFRPLYDATIRFSGQPVALVVADTFELARYAATLVKIEYRADKRLAVSLEAARSSARALDPGKDGFTPPPPPRGEPDAALAQAAVRVEAEYTVPVEHHNPMEPHACTAIREDDGSLTVYDKTQGVLNSESYLMSVFGLKANELRVRAPYVGGAFGAGLRPQYPLFLAVLAARELGRSVRVTLTRQQMFTGGYRPGAIQKVALGSTPEGQLEAIVHECVAQTSQFEDYVEVVTNWSAVLYRCPNVRLGHQLVPLDFFTPLDMRAPGAAWGLFALESAMDELAAAAGVDPVELRLRNYAERDQVEDKDFSSKELRACYREGAERFGWARRQPAPRSTREGRHLIGWGMAGGIWEALLQQASARAVLTVDGRLEVSSATTDIGTGTYTVMTQIAAETLGLPVESVTFKLGDSKMPMAPLQGGSFTAATVGSAVKLACEKLRAELLELAQKGEGSPLAGAKPEEIAFSEGRIHWRAEPARGLTLAEAMRAGAKLALAQEATAAPDSRRATYSHYTHSAVFVEVRVDEELGKIEVTRVVSAVAGGRILNPKTARSQILGGVVWGISMALHEESVADEQLGRFMNHNLAEYHVPSNADIREIEVIFVEEHDEHVNALGIKGLGEIGVVGVAAAIANAVFHATGRRIRSLPITLDKLL